MRSRLVVLCRLSLIAVIVVAALGIAGCGSTAGSTGTAAATTRASDKAEKQASSHQAKRATVAALPSRLYRVTMTGAAETRRGARGGSAQAAVALHGGSLHVCWEFSQLKGFTHPTYAHVHQARSGAAGYAVIPLSVGNTFLSKGCAGTNAALIKAIEANPRGFYVDIHSTKYILGAVRAQL